MTNDTTINFRTKFSDHIQNGDTEYRSLISAFEKFIILDKISAIDIIWRMSYSPCSKALYKIGMDPESFPEEFYTSLRNELRYQYEKCHHLPGQISRDFWSEEVPVFEEAIPAFDELAAQSNIIVATIIYQKCHIYLLTAKDVEDINRAIYLVGSDQENYHYGGICKIGFKDQEEAANYLKPIHSKIHKLLDAMFNSGRYQKDSLVHKPFEHLDQQIKDKGNDLPFTFGDEGIDEALANQGYEIQKKVLPEETPIEKSAKEIVHNSTMFKSITTENVLEYKDVFSKFAIARDMSSLVELSKLGFDLNQVVAKETAICNFIQAVEALSA